MIHAVIDVITEFWKIAYSEFWLLYCTTVHKYASVHYSSS